MQPSLFDPTRAPAGKHTAWAYCHVPNGSTRDMTEAIEAQVERFAPGFKDLIAARSAMGPAEVERRNPNYVGGDINGGVQDLRQLFTRPVARAVPYSTPVEGLTSARPPRRRAAACMACAGTSRPAPRCAGPRTGPDWKRFRLQSGSRSFGPSCDHATAHQREGLLLAYRPGGRCA